MHLFRESCQARTTRCVQNPARLQTPISASATAPVPVQLATYGRQVMLRDRAENSHLG
jgi:hypothetical protein